MFFSPWCQLRIEIFQGLAGELVNVLREAGQIVPDDLLKFGTHVKKKVYFLLLFCPCTSSDFFSTINKDKHLILIVKIIIFQSIIGVQALRGALQGNPC